MKRLTKEVLDFIEERQEKNSNFGAIATHEDMSALILMARESLVLREALDKIRTKTRGPTGRFILDSKSYMAESAALALTAGDALWKEP